MHVLMKAFMRCHSVLNLPIILFYQLRPGVVGGVTQFCDHSCKIWVWAESLSFLTWNTSNKSRCIFFKNYITEVDLKQLIYIIYIQYLIPQSVPISMNTGRSLSLCSPHKSCMTQKSRNWIHTVLCPSKYSLKKMKLAVMLVNKQGDCPSLNTVLAVTYTV